MAFLSNLWATLTGKKAASPSVESVISPTAATAAVVPDALGGTAPSAATTAATAAVDTTSGAMSTQTPTTPTDTVGAPTPIGLPAEPAKP